MAEPAFVALLREAFGANTLRGRNGGYVPLYGTHAAFMDNIAYVNSIIHESLSQASRDSLLDSKSLRDRVLDAAEIKDR